MGRLIKFISNLADTLVKLIYVITYNFCDLILSQCIDTNTLIPPTDYGARIELEVDLHLDSSYQYAQV